jgi:signal transduction histidine kinase
MTQITEKTTASMPGLLNGLSFRIITAILAVILVVELLVFMPSAANFRLGWLADHQRVGIVAARVLDAAPDAMTVPQSLTDRLLNAAGALAIAYRSEGQSQLIAHAGADLPHVALTIDMDHANTFTEIAGTLDTLFAPEGRVLRIMGTDAESPGASIEVLMPEAPLKAELGAFALRFFFLLFVLAIATSATLYVIVSRLLIAPIRRLTGNLVGFRAAPENGTLIISASRRRDEIGLMHRELRAMETDIYTLLRQRRHLADLGLAVAKINHDLRNTLTSAQLLSDQVANIEDPAVQRLAPRLVQSIGRAVGFAQQVLDYGRQNTLPPTLETVDLKSLLDDAAGDAAIAGHPRIEWRNRLPQGLKVSIDPGQFTRLFANLLKNAREALEQMADSPTTPRVEVTLRETPASLVIDVLDNGPGLPPRAREHLFEPFEGSGRSGGTGLGLVIARELAEAHGATLVLTDASEGTCFELTLPRALKVA